MWKYVSLGLIGSGLALGVSGHIKKQFSVENLEDCSSIVLRTSEGDEIDRQRGGRGTK